MEAAYNNWFHGYVSGFNVYWHPRSGNILGQATWNEIAAFIDVQCSGNLTKSVAQALDPLMTDLIKRQAHEKRGMPRPSVLTVQVTCRQWSDAKDDKVLRVFWGGAARGYLTAYNRWGPDKSGDFLLQNNDELIDRWISNWCDKRSSSTILQGMESFIKYVDKERAAGRINPGSTPANELVVPIT
ncbi:hypothetical protein J2Y58_003270 [Sphingomonas sp. BE138]|uniref:hypothetical protein n=1 Tax=Sphingomonas sp. BE138 TaxID=2817845 RepID=UPI00285D9A63|nr:hypothetical protein [Sphingomonas sp. BE138]MDR6789895.1 hypothetical protein [Sphingomonas sp. BE138]